MPETYDVVVIGAGVAGLMAARTLSRAGKRVVVLEARERIGGRIETRRDFGPHPIEAGAEFMHGEAPILRELAAECGLRPALLEGPSLIREGDAFTANGEAIGRVQEELAAYRGPEVCADALVDRWIAKGKLAASHRVSALRYIEGFNAADAHRASALALADQERAAAQISGENTYRVLGGYDALPHHLASALDPDSLKLRAVATRVTWSRGEVRVSSRTPLGSVRPELSARAAVITLPIGVLRGGAVAFDPPLPQPTREAIAQIESGPVVKVVVRLAGGLARRILPGTDAALDHVGFVHGGELAFPTWWPLRPILSDVFTGWAAGPVASALDGLDDDHVLARAFDSLAALLDVPAAEVDANVAGTFVTHWQRDAFARGAYSWMVEGGSEAPRVLAAPIEDTLFFAGEAANTRGHGATVHGALESGRDAAAALLGCT